MNEKGSILIITLLVLVLGSLIAVSSVNISTQETRIASNEHIYTTVFFEADAGIAPGIAVLLDTLKNKVANPDIPAFLDASRFVNWTENTHQSGQNTFLDELMGLGPTNLERGIEFQSPHDFSWSATDGRIIKTTVLVKRQGPASPAGSGSSVEFATGYEGSGYGSGSGMQIFYTITSSARQGSSGSSSKIETEYRKISKTGE